MKHLTNLAIAAGVFIFTKLLIQHKMTLENEEPNPTFYMASQFILY